MSGIQPGDIGFDEGGGFVAFLIRLGSLGSYAHSWVYVREETPGSRVWETHEARGGIPGRLKVCRRKAKASDRTLRLWRDEEEQDAILACSYELIGSRYAYGEIIRIIFSGADRIARKAIVTWLVILSIAVSNVYISLYLLVLLGSWAADRFYDNPETVICSNHCAQAALAGRADLELSYHYSRIWPTRLERDLELQIWADNYSPNSTADSTVVWAGREESNR